MLRPRSFRGDHWTLNSDMLKYELEDGVGLCGDCSRSSPTAPHLITDGSFDNPHRSEHIVNGILPRDPCESCTVPVTHVPSSLPHGKGSRHLI